MCIRDRDDIDQLEYPNQPIQYVIEVENGKTEYQLFYSEDGDLMHLAFIVGERNQVEILFGKHHILPGCLRCV